MEGTVQYEGSGDVFFAFYKGNEQLTEMPKKGAGLGFERAECSNGASVEWDSNKWAPKVLNITKTKTKCTLYFSANANNYSNIEDIMKSNSTMVAYDDTVDFNLRYIGASPNNYIDIGDKYKSDIWYGYYSTSIPSYKEYNSQAECTSASSYNVNCKVGIKAGEPILWRIIGVMNNMTVINVDGSESPGQSLIKIIRADSIGGWNWDSSARGVNDGKGVNEWSQADLMTTLNAGAYWNKESGQCYSGSSQKACDFSNTGLTSSVKDKLVKVRWNTGTMPDEYSSNTSKITASYMYEAERSSHNGKELCASSGGSYCNDPVERRTTWDGYIGLMYPSDYGYAVGRDVRSSCLAGTMDKWDGTSYGSNPDCKENDWLRDSSNEQWTLTPAPYRLHADFVFYVSYDGKVSYHYAYAGFSIRPVAYLRSNTQIVVGEGTKENPHTLKA